MNFYRTTTSRLASPNGPSTVSISGPLGESVRDEVDARVVTVRDAQEHAYRSMCSTGVARAGAYGAPTGSLAPRSTAWLAACALRTALDSART